MDWVPSLPCGTAHLIAETWTVVAYYTAMLQFLKPPFPCQPNCSPLMPAITQHNQQQRDSNSLVVNTNFSQASSKVLVNTSQSTQLLEDFMSSKAFFRISYEPH